MAIEIGSLLIDMRADVARLAQDMAKVQGTVDGAMNNVQKAAAKATTALGLIGVGVSVAGMVGIVKHAVGAMAALDDMAATAGTTVENMSALADIAQIGGHNLNTVETVMVRLNKALAGGDDEAKGAGKALAALGLEADKLRGMDTADALLLVAEALDKWSDKGGKAVLMQDLLGKSGATAIPFMQDLAEAGRLNASATTDQAAAAERLEKDINAVRLEGDKMTRALVANMLPALGDIARAMRLAAEEGGTLKAIFVGFGGLADQFVTPWKAAFLGLGAGLNEMLATFEEGLAKITFGGVAERHQKAALAYREAARAMNLQIAGLDNRRGSPAPGPAKPDLDYKTGGNDGKAGTASAKTPLQKMLEEQQRRIAALNGQAGDEQMVSVDSVSRQSDKKVSDDLEKRRIAMEAMAEQRMELTRIETEGEEAVREAMEKTSRAVKEQDNIARDLGLTFSSAFEDAIVGGKKFSDVLKGLGQDLARIIMRKSITEPLGNAASGFLKSIDWGKILKFDGGGYTGNAPRSGGVDGQGGFMAIMHPRETVIDHTRSGSGGGPSGTVNNFMVDMRGASVEAVSRLEQLVMSVNGSIERRALNVMTQARVRGA